MQTPVLAQGIGQRFRGGRGGKAEENDDFTDSRLENLIKGCLLIAHSDDFSSLIKWHLFKWFHEE